FGSLVQSISTACKVVPIVILIVFGLIKGTGTNPILSPMLGNGVSFGVAFGQVLIATLFVYDGWINIGSIAGELKNPGKDLPKAIIGGISIVMALYIAINLAYLWVLPANELAKVSVPAALVADKIFGSMGGEIISIGILIAAFGSLNGYLLTGPRVVFALSKKGYLPFSKSLKKINQGGSPINAIILTAVIGAIYAATGEFNLISNLEIFTVWIFYVLTFIGIFKLRFTRPNMERPYKVLGYPVIPAIAIAGGIFVLINQLFMAGLNSSLIAIGGILITLLGLPVHRYMVKKEKIKNEHKNVS
ncbi:MAG: amino acid permease, partial [Clostridiaceae bacterium]|nr:amino acid permease [Clostridiaceae bacterium]